MREIYQSILNKDEVDYNDRKSIVAINCAKCGIPKYLKLGSLNSHTVKKGCRKCSPTKVWTPDERLANSQRISQMWESNEYRHKCIKSRIQLWNSEDFRMGFRRTKDNLVQSLNPMFTYIRREKGKHLIKCLYCSAEKYRKPLDFYKNCSCRPQSAQEGEIATFIGSLGFNCNRLSIGRKSIDVYIPSLSIGIEYNSYYWHSSKFQSRTDHQDKFLIAESCGVKLITVWEDQWLFNRHATEIYLTSEVLGTRIICLDEEVLVSLDTLDYYRYIEYGYKLAEIVPPKEWSYSSQKRCPLILGDTQTVWDCGLAKMVKLPL
jgi:hypothetical protein